MRSYTRTIEKWILSLVMICLMVGCGVMDVFAAGYDPVSISIPFTHIYDADKNRTNDTFKYTITPQNGAPAPANSSKGVYTFSLKGAPGAKAQSGEVDLSIQFERPGEYLYKVASAKKGKSNGFIYESRTYTIKVYVQNDSNGGLTAPQTLVTLVGDDDGRKYQRLQLNPAHETEEVPAEEARPTTTPKGDGTVPAVVRTNGQPAPANNGGGNAPAVAGEPEEEPAPEEEPTPVENIVNRVVPKVVPKANPDRHYWSLLNLISAILTTIASGILVYRYFERIDTEEDEYIIRRKGSLRLAGIVLSIVSIATFLLTESFKNPMGWIDEWTPFMITVLVIDLVLAAVVHKKYGDGRTEEEAA